MTGNESATFCSAISRSSTHPLLQVLSELVVNLELLVEVLELVLVNVALLHGLHRGWLRRLEEVEERVYGNDLLDHTGPVGVYRDESCLALVS
jgi:hypothetical protein